MDRQQGHGTSDAAGFTVVLCDSCEDGGELPVLAALREVIRRCPHGMLVRATCPLGRLWCHAGKVTGALSGHTLLVQRCTRSRSPVGEVMLVGPVRTAEDLAATARWLEPVPGDIDDLPRRLREIPRTSTSN
ncbi:hypothetical protein ABT337_04880 [Saccharopolyspora hirsuta]|uniref:hypothetical protein n=1 Tax=Saccharopolyspora hirsuta TaxID=1837 RepID=UPI00332E1CDB